MLVQPHMIPKGMLSMNVQLLTFGSFADIVP